MPIGTRDLAFMGAAGAAGGGEPPGPPAAPIGTDDADTWVWYKATDHITAPTYIGDKMDTTTNKASAATPNMNLQQVAAGSLEQVPETGGGENMLYASEVLNSGKQFSGCTLNDATHCTFTAQNGYCRMGIYWIGDEPGITYVFKLTMRAVSGNTNLHFYHQGSATGNSTAVAVTGTLATYTVEFLAPATVTTAIYCGLQDQNAAGFGQVEITKWQLYRKTEHSGTYITQPTTYFTWPTRLGYCAWNGGFGSSSGYTQPGSYRTLSAGVMTMYAAAYIRNTTGLGYMITSHYPNLFGCILGYNTGLRVYAGGSWSATGTNAVPLQQWCILTAVFNGASSEVRINGDTGEGVVGAGALGNIDRIQVGYDSYAGSVARVDWHELIVRQVADNTAKQDEFIEYLAGQVGITL